MKNDDENFHANTAKARSRDERRTNLKPKSKDMTTMNVVVDAPGIIDATGPQPGVTVRHDRITTLPLPNTVDGNWRKIPRQFVAWAAHRAEMAARKARRAEGVSAGYDRATGRSVVRSTMRKMNGRWDGKPVIGGGAPNWGAMKP